METITRKQLKTIVNYEHLTDFYTTYGIETYLHPNGKVTLDFETHGITFDSRSDALDYLVPIFGMAISETHILKGLMEDGDIMVSNSMLLIDSLLLKLNIDSATPDSSKLLFVEKYVNENKEKITLLREVYPGIVALTGEFLIKKLHDAEWEMKNDELSGIIEPHVAISSNPKQSIALFLIVYKEMFEYDKCALIEHLRIYIEMD